MKAEYLIGLEILAFLIGFFIRDLKDLGAAQSPPRYEPRPSDRERQPW